MATAPGFLIDTNILLRLSRKSDPQNALIQSALNKLNQQGVALYFTLQNIAEFWNVCTRPAKQNGYGLSVEETRTRVMAIESTMTFLPEDGRVYPVWLGLVLAHRVRGVQVHDAHLAASAQVHGVAEILTFNAVDFQRFTTVRAVHPAAV